MNYSFYMMHSSLPTPEQLYTILKSTDLDALPITITNNNITALSIQGLKDYSAKFYFSEPARAKEIAQVTHDVSILLPEPAPSLGIWTLANALVYTGEYNDAVDLYRIARARYLSQGLDLDAARLAVGFVFVLTFTGKSSEAMDVAQETESILTASAQIENADLRRLGNVLMNIGLLHEVEGRYEDALVVYDRQGKVIQELKDDLMLAQMRHNQACAFMRTNAWNAAVHSFAEAERLFKKEESYADLIRLYANRSELFVALKRYDAAKESVSLAQSLAVQTDGSDIQQQWLVLLEAKVELASEIPITETLIHRLHQAMSGLKNSGNFYLVGLAAVILGRCFIQRNELHAAESALAIAKTMAEETGNRELLFRTRYRSAQVHCVRKEFNLAIHDYEEAIGLLESIRQELKIETFRSEYLTDKLTIFQDLAYLYLETGRGVDAFQTIERARSRLLAERMHFRLDIELQRFTVGENGEIDNLAIEIREQLQYLDTLYQQQRLSVEDNIESSAKVPDIISLIRSTEESIQSLSYELQRRQPLLSPLVTGQIANLMQIQSILQEEILIEYFIVREDVQAMIIRHDRSPIFIHLGKLTQIERAYQGFAANIERTLQIQSQLGTTKLANLMPKLVADANHRLNDLYKYLFAPISDLIPPDTNLIISGEDILHYIPFHALHNGLNYLCEHHRISYIPSATLFKLCLRQPKQSQKILLCGYTTGKLDAVNREIATLKNLFPAAETVIGDTATTDVLLQNIADWQLIHLATHARFRSDNPMLSELKLADRGLALTEIARLTLNAELVTLSGCETGYGQVSGADMISLAAGFLGSGARSLLVSLWRIEDQVTADFMAHFYRYLLNGMPRSSSLQLAQCAFIKGNSENVLAHHAHPAYWAPYVLLGNPRSLLLSK